MIGTGKILKLNHKVNRRDLAVQRLYEEIGVRYLKLLFNITYASHPP